MFTRLVKLRLKEDATAEVTRLVEHEIIPLLRQQPGFRDMVTLISPERAETLAVSLWDTKKDAEAYHRTGYQEILKILARVVEGVPEVETYELANSTFHKLLVKGA